MTPFSTEQSAAAYSDPMVVADIIVKNSASTPEELRYALSVSADFAPAVAMHPQLDEALRAWLWDLGIPSVRQAIYVRFREELSAATTLSGDVADLGVDYVGLVTRLVSSGTNEAFSLPENTTRARSHPLWGILTLPDSTVELTENRVLLGRAPKPSGDLAGAQIVRLPDERRLVSSTHALLEYVEHGWVVTDLNSTNGTVVPSYSEAPIPPGTAAPVEGLLDLGGYKVEVKVASNVVAAQGTQAWSDPTELSVSEHVVPSVARLRDQAGVETELFSDCVLVGRNPDSTIVPSAQMVAVDDPTRTMSKTHARLDRFDGAWHVTDLGATNGVKLGQNQRANAIDPGVPTILSGPFYMGDRLFTLLNA